MSTICINCIGGHMNLKLAYGDWTQESKTTLGIKIGALGAELLAKT